MSLGQLHFITVFYNFVYLGYVLHFIYPMYTHHFATFCYTFVCMYLCIY